MRSAQQSGTHNTWFLPTPRGFNSAHRGSCLTNNCSAGKSSRLTAAEIRHFFECSPKKSGHALADIPPEINPDGRDATFDVPERNGSSQPLQAKAFGRKNLP